MSSLHALLSRHVAQGTMPGVVASYGTDLDPLVLGATGPDGPDLAADAIFRIQSMTKAMVAVATLRLVQDGVLDLDEPVASWLPQLAAPRVLRSPDGPLEDTEPLRRPITVRHLLTCTSGVGMMTTDSPLKRAMASAEVEAGAEPVALGAGAWLDALASLPLAFQPGEGWRYHHSFGLLGILLGRAGGGSTEQVLRRTVLSPAGMVDTGFSVPPEQVHRLLPAWRRAPGGFERTEPAAAGFSAAPAPFDVSHSELVSTLADVHAFLRALLDGRLIAADLLAELRRDQIDAGIKREDSFFPGFWESGGWGFGVGVTTAGPHRGRFGWSGGLGTDFFVDPDGTCCLLMMQVEMDEAVFGLLGELQQVDAP